MIGKPVISAKVDQHRKLLGLHQMDVFGNEAVGNLIDVPEWRELPRDVQEALISLMTQLMLEHVRASAAPAKTEAGHDL